MADYKGIKGFKVQSLASDPTLVEGQIWYNTAGYALKYNSVATAWTTVNSLNTARDELGGAGSTTAAVVYGGAPGDGVFGNSTETYDGTSWTTVANLLNASAGVAGVGTSTAALRIGGYGGPTGSYKDWTEEFDGTSWTAGGGLATARGSCAVFGIQTAATAVGGYSPGYTSAAEEYNGSTWSSETAYPATFASGGGAGTTTAGMCFGGNPGGKDATNEYDGSTWTAGGALNTGRDGPVSSGGTVPAAMCSGGRDPTIPGVTDVTEQYDGSAWTEVADLNTARKEGATDISQGTQTASLVAGGHTSPGPRVTATEEFGPGTVVKTVTIS